MIHDIPHRIYVERLERFRVHEHLAPGFTEPATLAVAFVMTVGLASFSYYALEMPFLQMKERWAPARKFEAPDENVPTKDCLVAGSR